MLDKSMMGWLVGGIQHVERCDSLWRAPPVDEWNSALRASFRAAAFPVPSNHHRRTGRSTPAGLF